MFVVSVFFVCFLVVLFYDVFGNISFSAFQNPNLACIEVDDTTYSIVNWTEIGPQSYFSEDCNYPVNCDSGTTTIPEPPTQPKDLLYITDVLGRTTYPVPNQILFYIYDDGSVEKKIRLER